VIKTIKDLIVRQGLTESGLAIPWSDSDFSRRVLGEHLNPENDIASRRPKAIDRQVRFIHHQLLGGKKSSILDLGCGPGLHLHRLAVLGHRCTGIDIAPAAIKYAQTIARSKSLNCHFIRDNYLTVEFGNHFDFIMLTFGDFNAINRNEGKLLVKKAFESLNPGGLFLLEGLNLDGTQEIGEREATWLTAEKGIFSDHPYLYLEECSWNEGTRQSTANYYIIDSQSATLSHYQQKYFGYSDNDYNDLLIDAGFDSVEFYPEFGQGSHDFAEDLIMIVARK